MKHVHSEKFLKAVEVQVKVDSPRFYCNSSVNLLRLLENSQAVEDTVAPGIQHVKFVSTFLSKLSQKVYRAVKALPTELWERKVDRLPSPEHLS